MRGSGLVSITLGTVLFLGGCSSAATTSPSPLASGPIDSPTPSPSATLTSESDFVDFCVQLSAVYVAPGYETHRELAMVGIRSVDGLWLVVVPYSNPGAEPEFREAYSFCLLPDPPGSAATPAYGVSVGAVTSSDFEHMLDSDDWFPDLG